MQDNVFFYKEFITERTKFQGPIYQNKLMSIVSADVKFDWRKIVPVVYKGRDRKKIDGGYDGILGLAPFKGDTYGYDANFMHHLVIDGYVNFEVFSIYVDLTPGNSSHIKFGGWEEEAVADGKTLTLLKTTRPDTFAVKLLEYEIEG